MGEITNGTFWTGSKLLGNLFGNDSENRHKAGVEDVPPQEDFLGPEIKIDQSNIGFQGGKVFLPKRVAGTFPREASW